VVALALTAFAAAGFVPALSSGRSLSDRVEAKRRHLDRVRDREGSLQAQISSINKKVGGLRVQIGSLERRERRAAAVLEERQAELARITARYEREHRRFVRLRERLRSSQLVLADRLVQIYKSDTPDLVTVILESDGFHDLLTRQEYVQRISDSDRALVERVRSLKAESARRRATLVDLKQRAEIAVEAVETKKRELADTRGELAERRDELTAARSKQKLVLGGVRQDREKVEGELARLSAQVQAQLGGTQLAGPIRQGSGQFIWPVNGPITSPFCERRSWESCHPGIDIGAGTGTPIRAAGSGTVAMASPMGGYGNYTCINHGGGLSTCYAHQSSIRVSAGQRVSQGQVIGLVGCTGLCFGSHLHFEVRVNGAVTNPLNYL
jgi:murein DD-endopeptidase MepM/ murein hydrolase activator NlpD